MIDSIRNEVLKFFADWRISMQNTEKKKKGSVENFIVLSNGFFYFPTEVILVYLQDSAVESLPCDWPLGPYKSLYKLCMMTPKF